MYRGQPYKKLSTLAAGPLQVAARKESRGCYESPRRRSPGWSQAICSFGAMVGVM